MRVIPAVRVLYGDRAHVSLGVTTSSAKLRAWLPIGVDAVSDLLDESACYRLLLQALHPKGLRCPQEHGLPDDQAPHDRHREPVEDYRCRARGKASNVFTATRLQGVRFSPARLIMILRGFCQGVTTLHLSQELGVGRRNCSNCGTA